MPSRRLASLLLFAFATSSCDVIAGIQEIQFAPDDGAAPFPDARATRDGRFSGEEGGASSSGTEDASSGVDFDSGGSGFFPSSGGSSGSSSGSDIDDSGGGSSGSSPGSGGSTGTLANAGSGSGARSSGSSGNSGSSGASTSASGSSGNRSGSASGNSGSSSGACAAESDTVFCSRLSKNCGQLTNSDNCGQQRTVTSCGTCASPQTCGGGGTSNVCGGGPACSPAYSQNDCLLYYVGAHVSAGGHNWVCSTDNCKNCVVYSACAPGVTGCPWGIVWTDAGPCL